MTEIFGYEQIFCYRADTHTHTQNKGIKNINLEV